MAGSWRRGVVVVLMYHKAKQHFQIHFTELLYPGVQSFASTQKYNFSWSPVGVTVGKEAFHKHM